MKNKTFHYGLVQSSYWLSYLPIFAYATTFLLEVGYSNLSIGLLFALANLSSIALQSLLASLVDRGKLAMKSLMLLLAGLIFFLALAISLKPLFILYLIMLISLMSLQPFVNALGVMGDTCRIKLDFGLARGMASLVYSLGSILLGSIMARLGIKITPYAGQVFIGLHIISILSYKFPEPQGHEKKEGGNILRAYPFLLPFLSSVVLLFFGYSMFHNYLVHLIRYLGGAEDALGLAIALSAFAEVPTMFSFSRLASRFSSRGLLRLSSLFFLIKALMDFLARSLGQIYLSQLLNALTFGLFVPASVLFLSRSLNKKDTAKGQALLTSALIAGNVLASSVGGVVMDYYGIRVLMALIIGIEILAFSLMSLALGNKEDRRR